MISLRDLKNMPIADAGHPPPGGSTTHYECTHPPFATFGDASHEKKYPSFLNGFAATVRNPHAVSEPATAAGAQGRRTTGSIHTFGPRGGCAEKLRTRMVSVAAKSDGFCRVHQPLRLRPSGGTTVTTDSRFVTQHRRRPRAWSFG